MIEIKDLSVEKSNRTILNKISLNFSANRFHMIVGPNGAGKTHLLRAICAGEYKQGSIKVLNTDIAWMPNQLNLPFNYTTEALLIMSRFSKHKGFPKKDDYEDIYQNLSFVGLRSKAKQSFNTLSSGEQAKAQIAWLLSTEAGTLIFDEPVAHLDIRATLDVLKILKNLSNTKTVIISHHDLSSVNRFADEVHFIKNGEIIASGTTSENFTSENIRSVFDVDCELTEEGYIHFLD